MNKNVTPSTLALPQPEETLKAYDRMIIKTIRSLHSTQQEIDASSSNVQQAQSYSQPSSSSSSSSSSTANTNTSVINNQSWWKWNLENLRHFEQQWRLKVFKDSYEKSNNNPMYLTFMNQLESDKIAKLLGTSIGSNPQKVAQYLKQKPATSLQGIQQLQSQKGINQQQQSGGAIWSPWSWSKGKLNQYQSQLDSSTKMGSGYRMSSQMQNSIYKGADQFSGIRPQVVTAWRVDLDKVKLQLADGASTSEWQRWDIMKWHQSDLHHQQLLAQDKLMGEQASQILTLQQQQYQSIQSQQQGLGSGKQLQYQQSLQLQHQSKSLSIQNWKQWNQNVNLQWKQAENETNKDSKQNQQPQGQDTNEDEPQTKKAKIENQNLNQWNEDQDKKNDESDSEEDFDDVVFDEAKLSPKQKLSLSPKLTKVNQNQNIDLGLGDVDMLNNLEDAACGNINAKNDIDNLLGMGSGKQKHQSQQQKNNPNITKGKGKKANTSSTAQLLNQQQAEIDDLLGGGASFGKNAGIIDDQYEDSDLDSADLNHDDSLLAAPIDCGGNIIAGQYTQWKWNKARTLTEMTLSDGFVRVKGREFLFKDAKAWLRTPPAAVVNAVDSQIRSDSGDSGSSSDSPSEEDESGEDESD